MRFFVEPEPGGRAGESLAAVVRAYLRDVPRGVVSTRLVGSTWGVPLDEDRVKKDIAQLRGAGQYKWRRVSYRRDP